jgi:hypothetical protein
MTPKANFIEHEVPFPICARHEMKVFMLATRNWLIDHVDLHATNMDVTIACVINKMLVGPIPLGFMSLRLMPLGLVSLGFMPLAFITLMFMWIRLMSYKSCDSIK